MGVFGELTGLGKAFWDLGVNGLTGVGEFVGEFARRTGDRAGLASVSDSKRLKGAMGSEILDGGQKVIEGMRLTTGFGEPEKGERFGQGWSGFNNAGETLTSAFPNDSWTGAAADAYADQNRAQTGRTNTVALLDRGVQTVIAREAYQVSYHRDKLDDQSNFLADLSYVTMALGLVPGYGKAMKATVEVAAVNAALSICSLELYELSREAGRNAAELQQAVGLYEGAAQTATPTNTTSPPAPPPPPPPPPPPSAPLPPQRQERQGPASNGTVASHPARAASRPPTGADLPQAPSAPADGLAQLGAVLAPLGALLRGAPQGAAQMPPGQPQAAPGGVAATKKATKKKDHDKEDDEGEATAGRDKGEAERAPVHAEADVDPDRLHAPMAVTFDADHPSMPPAATTPAD